MRKQRVREDDSQEKQRGDWNFRGLEGKSEGWRELKKIPLEEALDNRHQSLNYNRSKEKSGKGSCSCLFNDCLFVWNDSWIFPSILRACLKNLGIYSETAWRLRMLRQATPPMLMISGFCDEPPGGNGEPPGGVHWNCVICRILMFLWNCLVCWNYMILMIGSWFDWMIMSLWVQMGCVWGWVKMHVYYGLSSIDNYDVHDSAIC